MGRARIYRWTRMLRSVERSSDMGPLSLCRFCPGCIIATRGFDFREGQAQIDLGQAAGDYADGWKTVPRPCDETCVHRPSPIRACCNDATLCRVAQYVRACENTTRREPNPPSPLGPRLASVGRKSPTRRPAGAPWLAPRCCASVRTGRRRRPGCNEAHAYGHPPTPPMTPAGKFLWRGMSSK
jgi:hypothetical protein